MVDMPDPVPVLTIDGPGGSGKGAVSAIMVTNLKWHYLDSGALYRVVGLLAWQKGLGFEDGMELSIAAKEMRCTFRDGQTFLDQEPVDDQIRTEQGGDRASRVAQHPEVREALLQWQRNRAKPPGLVADGRDMGTVVFPQATCKIFLTASARSRAERRFNQLRLKGFDVTIEQIFEDIRERDERDATRFVSPLKPAEDAVVLDTTEMSIDEVVETVSELLKLRLSS